MGLLIGAERERRKTTGSLRSTAGIRTFALASLAGSISILLGGEVLLAVVTAVVGVLVAAGYVQTQEQDPGLTSRVFSG